VSRGGPYRNVSVAVKTAIPASQCSAQGALLGAPEIAVVASAGLADVQVGRQPKFMVVSTGDELIEPGRPIEEHQVRRSNPTPSSPPCAGVASSTSTTTTSSTTKGCCRIGCATSLERDVLILSGGVSKGKFRPSAEGSEEPRGGRSVPPGGASDRASDVVRIGPGGRRCLVCPAIPWATLVCLIRYVVPAMNAAMGARRSAPERMPSRRLSN